MVEQAVEAGPQLLVHRKDVFEHRGAAPVLQHLASKDGQNQVEVGLGELEVGGGLEAAADGGCKVFHAGADLDNGRVVTAGGRVLCVVAEGTTFREAQTKAYAGVDRIAWEGAYVRRDIGYRAVAREDAAR